MRRTGYFSAEAIVYEEGRLRKNRSSIFNREKIGVNINER